MINSLAGRAAWLDWTGRIIAVFGLLAVLLLVLGRLWQPHWGAVSRKRYLVMLLISVALCALSYAGEAFLSEHVLHNDLRMRPAAGHWATVLVVDGTRYGFPAWPMVIAFALAAASYPLSRRFAGVLAGLGALQGISLVFVGINYPLDTLIGAYFGAVLGYTAVFLARTPFHPRLPRPGLVLCALWLIVLGAAIGLASAMHVAPGSSPAAVAASRKVPAPTGVLLTPAPDLLAALNAAASPARVRMQAATNTHLRVALVEIELPTTNYAAAQITDLARITANTVYTHRDRYDLLTLVISADFGKGRGEKPKAATLYTATIARADVPARGFPPGRPLPGKKFMQPELFALGSAAPSRRPSPNRQ